VRFSEEKLRTEKDDRVQQLLGTIDELRAEVVRLRTLLHRDHTGLAAALGDVVREAEARLWVVDGRGSYEWDDERYRKETGLALRQVGRQCLPSGAPNVARADDGDERRDPAACAR
jgi:cob(I)alamin adenosyltransferase